NPSPNPNVLIEYGWALKSLGHGRMLPVMNSYYGAPKPENMPFDMRHLKFPTAFYLPPDADSAKIAAERAQLSKSLEANLRTIFLTPGVLPPARAPAAVSRREDIEAISGERGGGGG